MSPGGVFFKSPDFSQILYSWGERFFVIGKISVGGSKNCLDSNLSSDMNNGITVGCILFLYPR